MMSVLSRDVCLSQHQRAYNVRMSNRRSDVCSSGRCSGSCNALTSVATLQLLEQGKLDLDSPASKWLPALADVQVLDGFASDGSPITRAPGRPVTMRHLLTHTSGFVYEFLSENVQK